MTEKKSTPPAFAVWLLSQMTRDEERHSILSDFSEIYEELAGEKGYFRASQWYWTQVFKSIPMFLFKYILWSTVMLGNSLKISFRSIKKHKGYSFINIFGLAAGMSCCLLILLWIQNELSYDRFHKNVDSIYRVRSNSNSQPAPLAPALKEDYPEIQNAVRFSNPEVTVLYQDKCFSLAACIFFNDQMAAKLCIPRSHWNIDLCAVGNTCSCYRSAHCKLSGNQSRHSQSCGFIKV